MDQKQKFIIEYLQGGTSFSQLCREANITRKTGYRYVEKYHKYGCLGWKIFQLDPILHPIKPQKKLKIES